MINKLSLDQLDTVTGGSWNVNTLRPEELSEYNALEEERAQAESKGDWDRARALEIEINAFIDRMNAIYGA